MSIKIKLKLSDLLNPKPEQFWTVPEKELNITHYDNDGTGTYTIWTEEMAEESDPDPLLESSDPKEIYTFITNYIKP